ncbi:MAG: hypothetical protein ACSHYF_10650 [Verrucomicrobiaceae bacterium]
MSQNLYSFVGATTALHFYLNASDAADQDVALAASADLVSVSEQILAAVAGNTDEETLKGLLDEHVVTVLESVEVIRNTSAYQGLDATLTDLLDGFYNLADALMGGGGCDIHAGTSCSCLTD